MDKQTAYKILGFSPDSNPTEQEINKAFKKKAAKLHPDVNKEEGAEEQFKELGNAKDFLLNPPTPPPNVQDFFGGFNPFDFFNQPKVRFHRAELYHMVYISFEESVLGCHKNISVNRTTRCQGCLCQNCQGSGKKETVQQYGAGVAIRSVTACPNCRGQGRTSSTCQACQNKGIVDKEQDYTINIPGGIHNRAALRLKGFGNVENNNGIFYTGDIILTVNVEPDRDMKIEGNDVVSNIDISLLEALKGTKKKVRTVLGEKTLIIKKMIRHKDALMIKNHGVNKKGRHLFIVNVLYPPDVSELINTLENMEKK